MNEQKTSGARSSGKQACREPKQDPREQKFREKVNKAVAVTSPAGKQD
jgi:hypothetical protein